MEGLWQLSANAEGIEGFVRDLGYELRKELKVKGSNISIEQSRLDKDSGFMLYWDYNHKHFGEIMITRNRKEEGGLVIDRFLGIRTVARTVSLPEHLRNAAQIYEDVDSFLERKYGKPKEHDGSLIYKAFEHDLPI